VSLQKSYKKKTDKDWTNETIRLFLNGEWSDFVKFVNKVDSYLHAKLPAEEFINQREISREFDSWDEQEAAHDAATFK